MDYERLTHGCTAAVAHENRRSLLGPLIVCQQRSRSDILASAVEKLLHIITQTIITPPWPTVDYTQSV